MSLPSGLWSTALRMSTRNLNGSGRPHLHKQIHVAVRMVVATGAGAEKKDPLGIDAATIRLTIS